MIYLFTYHVRTHVIGVIPTSIGPAGTFLRSARYTLTCPLTACPSIAALMQGPASESPYGEEVDPPQAPEAISKAVASLPPEQMFELMKQMKLCIQVHYLWYFHLFIVR